MTIINRPWGKMWKLIHTERFWLKVIWVYRGQRTSEQYHYYRTEFHLGFWACRIVPARTLHRMTAGLYLELAFGHPIENDIIRKEDDYGRA